MIPSRANVGQCASKSKPLNCKKAFAAADGGCRLFLGDCLELLAQLADESVDAVLTDPPYGVTDNPWDKIPPLSAWWTQIRRVTPCSANVAVFSQQPFTTELINSNRKEWRYELVWYKPRPTGFLNAKKQPLRCHEHVQLFGRRPSQAVYTPQMTAGKPYRSKRCAPSTNYRTQSRCTETVNEGTRYPRSVLEFANPCHKAGHPTQKPLPLIEWLVLTYTRPGDLVCDPYFGSGTTALACIKHGRRFIGFERDEKYFEMAARRLQTVET